jgi:3-(3-hydroxy-phenyl)propionate hydroxylase
MKYKPKPRLENGFLRRAGGSPFPGRLFPQPTVQGPDGEVLLDEALGDGFALLAPPQTSPGLFDQLPEGSWMKLNPRRVAVRPKDDQMPVPDGVTRVVDLRGEFARMLPDLPSGLVLIRPDRYTAALVSHDRLQSDFRQIDALIAKTWNGI